MIKKTNNKIWKWIITSLLLLLFGGSLIANIIFLPKYYALKHNDNTLNIDITAYDETTFSATKLFLFHYQTTMVTLGDLMAQYPANYHLKALGNWGRVLTEISYQDEENNNISLGDPSFTSGPYWMIYYKDKESLVGIDDLYLHMNDQIQLKLKN